MVQREDEVRVAKMVESLKCPEAYLDTLRRKHPKSNLIMLNWCRFALACDDTSELSEQRLKDFLIQFPSDLVGPILLSDLYRRKGEICKAEGVLGSSLSKAAGTSETAFRLYHDYAFLAEVRGNWADAIDRWSKVMALFAKRPEGLFGHARALFKWGRLEDADESLGMLFSKYPSFHKGLELHANIAAALCHWADAAKRWKLFRDAFEDKPAGYVGGVEAELCLGNLAEAAGLAASAELLFATKPNVIREISQLLSRKALGHEITKEAPASDKFFDEITHASVLNAAVGQENLF